ncbi:hypothetical protein BDV93DRAFT_325803 [Ceratobasidium sp. AG-I]|nr:hypothetical protein BDV93DRAFT_325803 [Ceratobasidium sp. AG-I]
MSVAWKKPFEFGVKAFRESRYEAAIEHFTRSIALDGTNAQAYDSRAAAYEKAGRSREALADTRKYIALQPDRHIGYLRSARIFLALQKYDRCLKMLGEARKRLKESDTSYARRIDELTEMESEAREGLQTLETRRRSAVDPLQRLPLELLVEICRITVDELDDEAGPRGASHFAVVLGSVCQSLRSLVHGTPVLWQCVVLSEKKLGRKSAFWLERLSGQALHSVAVVDFTRQSIPRLIETLAVTRPDVWRNLHIEGGAIEAHTLYHALRSLYFRVHSFSVKCPPATALPIRTTYAFDVEEVARVLSPVLETQKPGTYARRIALNVQAITTSYQPLPYVTHLELSMNLHASPQSEILVHTLHAMPGLRTLVFKPHNLFTHQHPRGTIPLDVPLLRLEHLEVLRSSIIGTMRTLQLPKLKTLDLQHWTPASVNILLYSIVECSPEERPAIREIRLNRLFIAAQDLKLVLQTFTNTLESLEISKSNQLDSSILESLSRPIDGADGPLLCPRLRDVNFTGTDELKAGPLVRLIKARLPPTPDTGGTALPERIRHITIDSCPGVEADALPWMRANVTGTVSCVYNTRAEARRRPRDRNL